MIMKNMGILLYIRNLSLSILVNKQTKCIKNTKKMHRYFGQKKEIVL